MKRFEIADGNTLHHLTMERRQNGDVSVAVWTTEGGYVIGRVVVPDDKTALLLDVLRAA